MTDFDELVQSRKAWLDNVLQPWCREASLQDLKKAAAEWTDIAGNVDTDSTLWKWAWSRFPALVHEGLSGVDETSEVCVTLRDSRTLAGYPDGRRSQEGRLVLLLTSPDNDDLPALEQESAEQGRVSQPYSIDDIQSVVRVTTPHPGQG